MILDVQGRALAKGHRAAIGEGNGSPLATPLKLNAASHAGKNT